MSFASARTSPALARTDTSLLSAVVTEVGRSFLGNREAVELSLSALLAGGHLLLEDVPGVGKTTLAGALAHALGLEFRRVQFTADLLPFDLLGGSVPKEEIGRFEFRPGPIFTDLLLADEINRAPPRTQSGLLQAMQERQVSIEDRTFDLSPAFAVIATQNPLDHHGTHPLPDSQLDRFLLRLRLGYPDPETERRILLPSSASPAPVGRESAAPVPLPGVSPLSRDGWLRLRGAVDGVHLEPALLDFVMELLAFTRTDPRIRLGVSPRGGIALLRGARARALVQGRDFVVPEDLDALLRPCLGHRLVPFGREDGWGRTEEVERLLDEFLERHPLPL